ncbi:MAG TPA: hypothetical protein DET40_18490 [Lentisphaeria bacterium]|nr:MAG: hypothetical protein A2X45_14630 [Lentisphaerae bacterium GWF2_50_93]HCE45533.1 hypothetical protein [Lentisphaeria bacterium]
MGKEKEPITLSSMPAWYQYAVIVLVILYIGNDVRKRIYKAPSSNIQNVSQGEKDGNPYYEDYLQSARKCADKNREIEEFQRIADKRRELRDAKTSSVNERSVTDSDLKEMKDNLKKGLDDVEKLRNLGIEMQNLIADTLEKEAKYKEWNRQHGKAK